MQKLTQHQLILDMLEHGWVCQKEFWDAYIRSPHKRRGELEAKGYEFETRPCIHGLKRSFDYRLKEPPTSPKTPPKLNETPQDRLFHLKPQFEYHD